MPILFDAEIELAFLREELRSESRALASSERAWLEHRVTDENVHVRSLARKRAYVSDLELRIARLEEMRFDA